MIHKIERRPQTAAFFQMRSTVILASSNSESLLEKIVGKGHSVAGWGIGGSD